MTFLSVFEAPGRETFINRGNGLIILAKKLAYSTRI